MLLSYQRRFRLDSKKNLFSKREVMHWNRLLREVVEPLSTQVFMKHIDMALREMLMDAVVMN